MNLEEKIYDVVIELKEDMAVVKTETKNTNGAVAKNTKKIYWLEKVLWTAFGAFGAVQFYLTYIA